MRHTLSRDCGLQIQWDGETFKQSKPCELPAKHQMGPLAKQRQRIVWAANRIQSILVLVQRFWLGEGETLKSWSVITTWKMLERVYYMGQGLIKD
jgi:hypothetical protein